MNMYKNKLFYSRNNLIFSTKNNVNFLWGSAIITNLYLSGPQCVNDLIELIFWPLFLLCFLLLFMMLNTTHYNWYKKVLIFFQWLFIICTPLDIMICALWHLPAKWYVMTGIWPTIKHSQHFPCFIGCKWYTSC